MSFFLGTGFIAGLETVPWVDLPVDFPEPDKSILSNYYFIIVVEPELKINMEFRVKIPQSNFRYQIYSWINKYDLIKLSLRISISL